jgi:hypothetical protein
MDVKSATVTSHCAMSVTARRPPPRAIPNYRPSEGASKNITHMPIVHRFYLFSTLPSLR